MIQLYKPTFGTDRAGVFFRCLRYEMGGFDLMTFWKGERFEGSIPGDVRITMGDGGPPDFTLLPISWYIFSDRAAERIASRAGDAVQFFDAPLYNGKTGVRINGHKVLNATKKSKCLDMEKSKVRYIQFTASNPAPVLSVSHFAFDGSLIPPDLHVFRSAETTVTMFFSRQLMEDLMTGDVLKNLAFLEYGGDEVREIKRKGAGTP